MLLHLTLANVIFPAPTMVYVTSLFLPGAGLLVLVAEVLILHAFHQGKPWKHLPFFVVAANVFSWFAGVMLHDYVSADLIPSGLMERGPEGEERIVRTADFASLATLGFLQACVLSIVLESAFLLGSAFLFHARIRSLFTAVAAANAASYLALYACARFALGM